jgi:hypothetical protein
MIFHFAHPYYKIYEKQDGSFTIHVLTSRVRVSQTNYDVFQPCLRVTAREPRQNPNVAAQLKISDLDVKTVTDLCEFSKFLITPFYENIQNNDYEKFRIIPI